MAVCTLGRAEGGRDGERERAHARARVCVIDAKPQECFRSLLLGDRSLLLGNWSLLPSDRSLC